MKASKLPSAAIWSQHMAARYAAEARKTLWAAEVATGYCTRATLRAMARSQQRLAANCAADSRRLRDQ